MLSWKLRTLPGASPEPSRSLPGASRQFALLFRAMARQSVCPAPKWVRQNGNCSSKQFRFENVVPSGGPLSKPQAPSAGPLLKPQVPSAGTLSKPQVQSAGTLTKPQVPSAGLLSKPLMFPILSIASKRRCAERLPAGMFNISVCK